MRAPHPPSDLPPTALDALLQANREADLLRFSTAGSVDDGKSTLIGRLLSDSKGNLRGPARGTEPRLAAAEPRHD
jgi:GTPase